MPTLATRLTSTGVLQAAGYFDEVSGTTNRVNSSGVVFSGSFDEVTNRGGVASRQTNNSLSVGGSFDETTFGFQPGYGFKGWQIQLANYRYLIKFDWDNCRMSTANMLYNDSITADGSTYTSDPNFHNIDGLVVYQSNPDGKTATCIYASGNYAATSNFSGYNYIGTTLSIVSLQSGLFGIGLNGSDVLIGVSAGRGVGCSSGNTIMVPNYLLSNSWSH
jgi:hypothetical protein